MKAMVYTKYGPPDVLKPEEIQKPTPNDDEVLVKVQAASVNPYDLHHLRAKPFFIRLTDGLRRPKNQVLGVDIAGQVEAVGSNVTQFQPGDDVFGDICECEPGAFTEYVSVPENVVALKPANLTFEQAAAVPMAAVTALHALRDKGQIQPGQKVLINGASGGVGTFAVQIAKSFGAEVTGVCSTRNVEMVRGLGADHVIDYTQQDFTQNGSRYDLILDNVANRSVSEIARALNPGGMCIVVGFTSFGLMLQTAFLRLLPARSSVFRWRSWEPQSQRITRNKKVSLFLASPNKADLDFLRELLETGKVVPVIDKSYPLHKVGEALRYLEKGHAHGKVVITVTDKDELIQAQTKTIQPVAQDRQPQPE